MAEFPEVGIITAMTIDTGHRFSGLVIFALFVTIPTGKLGMRAFKHQAGLFFMVELPEEPVVGVVAITAIPAENALVGIILCVAIKTLPGGVCKSW